MVVVPKVEPVYNVLAVNKDGHKELIGMYVSESEGANFWLSVLTDLKARGMKDVLIACIDNSRDLLKQSALFFLR